MAGPATLLVVGIHREELAFGAAVAAGLEVYLPETGPERPAARLRVEIAADKLLELMRTGSVCAADLRCLDCESKTCLWRLCLDAITGRGRRRRLRGDPEAATEGTY